MYTSFYTDFVQSIIIIIKYYFSVTDFDIVLHLTHKHSTLGLPVFLISRHTCSFLFFKQLENKSRIKDTIVQFATTVFLEKGVDLYYIVRNNHVTMNS